jgi:uncharacterized protein YjbJ (UPF0337 family)
MSDNRIEGAVKKGAGAVKQGVGRATGDERMEGEGFAEKHEGNIQNKVGQVQDKVADAIKRH